MNFFISIKEAFKAGGWPMGPIALLLVVSWGFVIERIVYLWKARIDKRFFLSQLKSKIMAGNVQAAIAFLNANPSPVSRIVRAGLTKFNRSIEEVQAAMDEAALSELPKIEARTGYLAMIANVATLAGLLGTILGMITSFDAASNKLLSAAEKSERLSHGIAEAMNCTAFGLICAVPALICYAILNGWTQSLLDDLNEVSVQSINLVIAHKKTVGELSQEE